MGNTDVRGVQDNVPLVLVSLGYHQESSCRYLENALSRYLENTLSRYLENTLSRYLENTLSRSSRKHNK